MKKLLSTIFLVSPVTSPQAIAQPAVGFGELYYEGMVVGTVVPPASNPKEGRNNLYVVPNQRAVIGVAPGDRGYHGGH